MARTLFPDILSAFKLDIKTEIKKLHRLFFVDTIKISETIYKYLLLLFIRCVKNRFFYITIEGQSYP